MLPSTKNMTDAIPDNPESSKEPDYEKYCDCNGHFHKWDDMCISCMSIYADCRLRKVEPKNMTEGSISKKALEFRIEAEMYCVVCFSCCKKYNIQEYK